MDKIKIRVEIEETIELYQKYLICKKKLSKEKSFISNLDSENCYDDLDVVRKYLMMNTKEDVISIFAIMDNGRHTEFDESNKQSLEIAVKEFEHLEKNQAIEDMLQKEPLIEYLKRGMEYFEL
jgi:hypothetical protein